MNSQKGTQPQRERLKEIDEMITVFTEQIRQCKYVLAYRDTDVAEHRENQSILESKINELNSDFDAAPQKLIDVHRQLNKIRAERDKITGKVTGRTKRVNQYKKLKAKLDTLIDDMTADGVDPENIEHGEEVSDYFNTHIS